ncbi:MAG: DUF4231 domain-containing protein [Oscillibacter sp.]|nr:DUF4231 domain-containing protein [Oscillibacter sp.]
MENQNQDVTTTQADVTPVPPDETPAITPTEATPTQKKASSSRHDALAPLVEEIQDPRTKDYVKNRLLEQMKWYSKKSGECKKQYHRLMSASIVFGALIPVTSLFLGEPSVAQVLIAVFGVAVTALNAYISLNNSKDLWVTYRNTREILLRTLYFYFNNAEKFSKGTEAEKDALLIEVCEAEMARENGTWRSMMEK